MTRARLSLAARVAALVAVAGVARAEGDGGGAVPAPDGGAGDPGAEGPPPLPAGPPPEVEWVAPRRVDPAPRAVDDTGPSDPGPKTAPARRRGPDNWTGDLGVHGYLVQAKHLLGAEVGIGRGIVAGRLDVGAAWNGERVQRFDTILLGPYGSVSLWVYAYRSRKVEARVGVGLFAIQLSEIDSSLLYFAGMTSGAASYFFTDRLSTFVRADVLPLRTRGFEIGVAPVLFQIGLEVSLW